MTTKITRQRKKKVVLLYQYKGYNGGFARVRILMWRCTLVGANGQKRFGGSWMAEGCGNPDKKYAQRDAESWSAFTGWPIVDLGRAEQFDEAPKD